MNKNELTLGSLFSGSGGFELAGKMVGIRPVFNSEVEPFGIRVTTKRLPEVKHYGDVSTLNGAELPPVDIMTWGSPCQGLSIAGKRKGLDDERSGLYVQAVRIVKEMLEATDGRYPKYCVFENVPGLLSSSGGEDFIACLDMMQGLGFLPDINFLDAQHMGVAQRRKRVYITWVQVDYILSKRTILSESIMLQCLTEILQIVLIDLCRAYGIELKKSTALGARNCDGGVRRRMNLFSLQKDDRLRRLQQNLDEIQATYGIAQNCSASNHGADQTAEIMSPVVDTKYGALKTGNQDMSIGQLLKTSLEEGLQIENGSITSTLTKETIAQKICFYLQGLMNMLNVIIPLTHSLEKTPMYLNFFEWVLFTLTEMEEFIDATQKHEGRSEQVAWHDLLWSNQQELSKFREYLERNLADESAREILPQPESLLWYPPQGSRARQGTAGDPSESSGAASRSGQLCLNDQGGGCMDVSEDVSGTLRAETHGHAPVVVDGDAGEPKACGFCTEHSAKSRSIGYEEERSPTLRAGIVPAAIQMYENHSQDTRYTGPLETAPTVSSQYGTGGNNQPFVVEQPVTLKIRSGCEGGGKGILTQVNKSATLACNNDQTLFVPEKQDSCYWDGGQTAGTLTDKNARGVQRMPDKGNFNCVLEAEPEQQAFGISSYSSHAMLSDNPHAGIYEAKTSRTLDLNGGAPTCQQGGIAIVEKEEPVAFTQNQRDEVRDLGGKSGALAAQPGMKQQTYVMEQSGKEEPTAFHVNTRWELVDLHGKSGALMASQSDQMQTFVLQGSMIGRDDKNGPQGSGVNEDVSFSLTSTDRHAVCAPESDNGVYAMTTGSFMETYKEQAPTLMARDYKDPTTVAPVSADPVYTVRRLTPVECARLQALPDWWCDDLGTENPTDEEISFWTDVFETHRKVITHASKPKTEKQIRKWLADPYSDNAAYRMYGNGICVNCAVFVLAGIVWADGLDAEGADA